MIDKTDKTGNDLGSNDTDLRERFTRLREEDAHRTPPFVTASRPASIVPRRSLPSPFVRLLAGALATVFIAVAAVLWLRHEPAPSIPANSGAVASITEWKAPTDFLLNTPGSEMLRTSPAFEVSPFLVPKSSPPQRTPHVRKKPSR